MGTKLKAFVARKPLMAQVVLFPLDHGARAVPFGDVKGPIMMDNDCMISEQLRPNRMRW